MIGKRCTEGQLWYIQGADNNSRNYSENTEPWEKSIIIIVRLMATFRVYSSNLTTVTQGPSSMCMYL